ncbi:MAG: hypothetical protein MUC55_00440 [Burkholderiales bacterium]|jgi:hypothetical protein|nr:hypothetical protein [Burkholderiales bacterium]
MASRPRLLALLPFAIGATPTAAAPIAATSLEAARGVLAQYAAQSAAQNVGLLELYSDRALVHTEAPRTTRVLEGRAYKRAVREALARGEVALDASQFRQATVERRGSRLLVRAQRYAANRCYWDAGYVVALEREGTRWVIVEERLRLHPEARCPQVRSALPPVAVSAQTGVIAGAGAAAFALGTASTLPPAGWTPPTTAPLPVLPPPPALAPAPAPILPPPALPPLPASSVAAASTGGTGAVERSAPRPSMFGSGVAAEVRVTPRATSAP